jgi:hypothetical protein
MNPDDLPSLEEITRRLLELNERAAVAGGAWVGLWVCEIVTPPYVGIHGPPDEGDVCHGREWLPGPGASFDAPAVAGRLLAAARDG